MSAPDASVLAALDELPWSWESGRCRALEFDFGVRVMDDSLASYLAPALAAYRAEGDPATLFSVVDTERCSPPQPLPERYAIYFGDQLQISTRDPTLVPGHIFWLINQRVVEDSRNRYVLLHSSAAERDGYCAIFPAPMGSGKTTLVSGLVRAGMRYGTDEAVAIDPRSGVVQPFPKALSIESGSWEVLGELRPELDADVGKWQGDQWNVSVLSFRPDGIASPCRIRFVIAPCYKRGGTTKLSPMRRAEALVYLIGNAFNLDQRGREGFDALTEVVRGADCYRLAIGDLGEACDLVLGLFEELS